MPGSELLEQPSYLQTILFMATFMISFLRGYFLILPLHTSTNVPLATRSTRRTSLRAISHCCFSRPYSLGWKKYIKFYSKAYTVKPWKFEVDFLKYSLIQNKFKTHWIQRIYSWSILITVYNNTCFGWEKETSNWDVSFTLPKPMFDREKNW